MNQKYFKAAEIFNLNFGMIGLPVPYKARSTKNKLLHVRDSLEYYFTRNWLLHSFYAKFLKKMKNFTEKELHPIPEFQSAKMFKSDENMLNIWGVTVNWFSLQWSSSFAKV